MTTPLAAFARNHTAHPRWRRLAARSAILAWALLLAPLATAGYAEMEQELQALTAERELLTSELEQYTHTMNLLQRGGGRPQQTADPAVNRLALEIIQLKKRVIDVTEREVALLQELISASDDAAGTAADANEVSPQPALSRRYSPEREAETVRRLHALLAGYYADLREAELTLPSEEERLQRAAAREDAGKVVDTTFTRDQVYLSGSEGSAALAQISERLADATLPESRRDIAPICAIKTRLFGSLIASESRSLRPVGKHHYIARVWLQPGDTIVRIKQHSWDIPLPPDANTREFMFTLYAPPQGEPEFHVFAIEDLLGEEDPHIPAWLPDKLQFRSRAG